MAYYGVQFNATSFTNVVMKNVEQRLKAAGELLVTRAQANFVGVSPPPSEPWDFPHIDPREVVEMRDYIDYTVFDRGDSVVLQAGIIGEDLPGRLGLYPGYLETGTSRMDPRPWLTITLDESWAELGGIMTGMGSP